MSIFQELKRRNVFRVGIAYLIVSWLIMQVADVMIDNIGAPDWLFPVILMILGIGFLLAIFFAWAFELTPEGIKREAEVDRSHSIAPETGRRLDRTIIVILVLAVAYFALDKFLLETRRDQAAIQQVSVESPPTAETAPEEPPPAAETDERLSVVVLPFVNMSADPAQEFFSDGLSEELLNVLAQIEDLRVISRTSAFAFKGKDVPLSEIAAALDVSHVLEGSVRSAGDQVRITAQLIEVETDSHLWSDAYNRRLENIFEIQQEIAEAIAAELQVELGASGASDGPTENIAAYEAFLRGRHHYQARGQEDMNIAVASLQEAVELDPEFDEAWANLAAALVVQSFYVSEGYESLRNEAEVAARRAIAADPRNGFSHAVLGLLHNSRLDYESAISELRTALELNPSESNSYLWMGIVLCQLGYVEDAIGFFERAERFDPVFSNLQNWLHSAYLMIGDLEEAEARAERVRELSPNFGISYAGVIELARGDLDGAERQALDAVESDEDREYTERMFAALRDPAKRDETIRYFRTLENPTSSGQPFYHLYQIGAVTDAVASWTEQNERGRGLRAANSLPALWLSHLRHQLNEPATRELFELSGLADYWRTHGDPDFCSVADSGRIECMTR